ncbi:Der GTPase-activating protein YihI [Vibrio natriegens]|uniref:Der GTPase-activating protein YihI n=1 Tax=Vibrio natriegens NBRC 15636 = ATCC 14048 = DSM 759 TaxID=1219067 RepID=A0AAN0Y0H5_VIBNA|nr:Der GTPase-activating protein YihI [Vibrio natriegens]ALR16806.1 aminotransferase [Vibrio natriegens NBRC 15636 = ATCC 14048 = DSM 759]ANQ11328.1 GTPase-activating protein [Vibrio natriegens NBRC 15636 = ATCC 14048 = DSM 759]EPM38538.1 aminotransferase [Vibrio natriegens NBRC 15636 = ATCC 14048 = DSM 759]MDX6025652.1 Der GTPase-activating protein YihI [Vibrio natriegens NBRC 15636 = ATCC 14048 = DSM 759]UUI11772.1 Der GTPase-activating protein YihI [Vibrio natriegens]
MSRSKKSRKPGAAGAPDIIVTRNRTESDVEGRLRKRAKKRKGLKTGNRNSDANEQKQRAAAQNRDPRLGSKKKIPLIVEPAKKMTKQERRLSAVQELEMLENDAQLNVLLDRIEAGENLGTGLQKYVDEKLDRIEKLMDQLGLLEPEEEEDFTAPAAKGSRNDDDLLADFDDINFDDYKG